MKKFRYRLETVLDVRRRKEEQELGKYNALLSKVRAIEDRIHETEEYQTRLMDEVTRELQGVPDVSIWKRSLLHADHVSRMIAGLWVSREQADKERLAQREHLLEAVKRRKILESLKEKARTDFNWEEAQKEQLELDEWAAIHSPASRQAAGRQVGNNDH
jgi:flagellar protein FliJ